MDPLCITEPSQLTDNTAKLAALDLSASEPRQITLVLLQPLANPATLASCLPSIHRNSTHNWQYLDLQPLSQAWRQAIINTSPTPNLVFDLSLPQSTDISSSSSETTSLLNGRTIRWDTSGSWNNYTIILTKDVMTMVNSIAIGVRMRYDGKVSFGLVFDEKEGLARHAMELLRKHLHNTEKEYKNSENAERNGEVYNSKESQVEDLDNVDSKGKGD
jgi:hypothetical protein